MQEFDTLIRTIEAVAAGQYSDEVMQFTLPEYPEHVRRLAEAMGMMMVKVEAREMRLTQLVEDLRHVNERVRENATKTVVSMAQALGARDTYSQGHVERVAVYAERLAKRMGLTEEEVESVRLGGVLHDVGKIGFSDDVFSNTDIRLSPQLSREIREHPNYGAQIVENLDFLGSAIDAVRAHHERMDGTGYPLGLQGDAIPLSARIVAIADCFDAITTTRSYQAGRPAADGCDILRKLAANGGLDPTLVDLFIREIEENGAEHALGRE